MTARRLFAYDLDPSDLHPDPPDPDVWLAAASSAAARGYLSRDVLAMLTAVRRRHSYFFEAARVAQRTLARDLGWSVGRVRDRLEDALDEGWLRVHRRTSPYSYFMTMPRAIAPPEDVPQEELS